MIEWKGDKDEIVSWLFKLMRTDDVVKATQEARTKNAVLLNDQGIAAIAILFSDVLAEVIKSPEILLSEKVL